MVRPLTRAKDSEIVAMIRRGYSPKEVAFFMNTTVWRIYEAIKREKPERRSNSRLLSSDRRNSSKIPKSSPFTPAA
jgi:hypothetical protein